MNEHYHISVLFDGSGVTQVSQAWFATALFNLTIKLGEGKDRHIKFSSKSFKSSRYFCNLLDEGVNIAVWDHQLEIVNDYKVKTSIVHLLASCSAHLINIGVR